MLIRFHIENFLSFKEEQEFSLVPGRVASHSNHLVKEEENGISILRAAAIFGKNASGKSNFINAINFAKKLIINQHPASATINVRPFRLDDSYLSKPSQFRFEVKLNDKIYDYGFSITRREVVEEWLFEVKKTTEKMLFERKGKSFQFGKIDFELGIQDSETTTTVKQAEQRLSYVGEDTRDNQLFLSAAFERNQPYFRDLYTWFDKSLHVIDFDSRYYPEFMIDQQKDFTENFSQILRQLDTDIEGIVLQRVDVEQEFLKAYPFVEDLKPILEGLEPGTKAIFPMPDNRRFAIKKAMDGTLEGSKIMTKHKKIRNSDYTLFELNWESEGTQRLMDLIPLLFLLKDSQCTIFIDELGRSLHPELTYKLVKLFLEKDDLFRSQLIFSSHEDFLLDFELLRRDEIWFVDKQNESSKIYSLEEFKPRYDKDIRRGYFQGRFGATPLIDLDRIVNSLHPV